MSLAFSVAFFLNSVLTLKGDWIFTTRKHRKHKVCCDRAAASTKIPPAMEEVRDSVVLTLSIPSEMNPTRSKRLLPFGIALALLAFLFWQPFFRLPWVNVSPFAAVPKGAPVIFQLNPGEAA
ncbi:MAG: hypothetical protein KDC30_13005, partial [Saprospiraceae bacterium]|nr:hypothetical protein [Saprospiraceae bacterium]